MNKDKTQEEIAAEELASKIDYTGKTPTRIKKEIQQQLFNQEKNIIFRLEELKGTFDNILNELGNLDNKYKDIQGIIDHQSTQFNKLSSDVELIESQKKVIETRMKNQQKLQDTLKILISGLSLNEDEKKTLERPSFSSTEDLRRAEDVVEKIGKFLQFQVDQFRNVKIYQNQVQSMNQELNSFINIFYKDLQEIAKKSSAALSEEGESREDKGTEAYLSALDMSNFKQALMKRRRLIKSLIQAKNNSSDFLSDLMSKIQRSIKYIVDMCKKQMRKNLKYQLDRSLIIKSKCSYVDKINAKISSIVNAENISQPNSLMQWFQDFINQLSGQIDLDLNYWTKYFSFDQKKFTKDDQEIQSFISEAYSPLFLMVNELVEESIQASPISAYCFLTSTLNYLTAKEKDEEEDDADTKTVVQDSRSSVYSYISSKSIQKNPELPIVDNSDTLSTISGAGRKESFNVPAGAVKTKIMENFLLDLKKELESRKKTIAHSYQKYLSDHDYKVKYAPPFDQSIYFSDAFRLMIDLFGPYISTYYQKDLQTYASYFTSWIKEQSKKYEKYENIRVITNIFPVMNKLTGSQISQYKDVYKKINSAYKENQQNYCIDLFCYHFTKFSEMWFKIKSVNPSDLESDSQFNAGKFVKSVQNTFSHIEKELDPILKRMKKHFCKDNEIIQRQFEALIEYIIEQYTEIEQLCWKALKIKVTPSIQEVQTNLQKKLNILFN
ncbi:exocyst complex component Sec3 (macronuclear) [Tetrahymena thermophila SB210]|uniref:Exocyst complex component Sec3 n=1 Tax=Tetrahymena thermophila (strain SB210) TaxID=312017 RepID=I7M675_TETTS|nr:exocyst complex component Sec3 [Tetrahymena thermophila SB210]EAR84494.2 exocyst complex component Sec3 [Tetrahymena thermophila SB210]|eukprot:XP_001032157.2 exocyst complex component Sec3 [Tetrahymena thermophila SB210]